MNKLKSKNKFGSEIYRGAKMGTQTLQTLLTKTKDKRLKDELIRELELYNKIERKIFLDLLDRNIKPMNINPLQSASAWITIQMETLFNKKPSHIATILIKGNNMGVIGITKILNQNTTKDEFLIDYALQFINMIEDNNEQLKKFLR